MMQPPSIKKTNQYYVERKNYLMICYEKTNELL